METVEHLIIGGGPAGLRAAQVLADSGREVLVVEKRPVIGPKTCAGGLTLKAVRLLEDLGLAPTAGLANVGHIAFSRGRLEALSPDRTVIRTVPRSELGEAQRRWTQAAGAEIRVGAAATELDLPRRRVRVGGSRVAWRHLIGADGASSAVRRALGLPSPSAYFAAEYNVPGVRLAPLRVECEPHGLASGYFWVFPHRSYTSVGAVAPKRLVPPPALRHYLDRRMSGLGLADAGARLEGAILEVQWAGFHFAGGVHLAGDAAGVPSALTAEGIYPALVTGEEVARQILEPAYPAPLTSRWLRVKRRHDRLAHFLGSSTARAAVLPALASLARCGPARRPMADWFLAG